MGSDQAKIETGRRVIFSKVLIVAFFSSLLLAGTLPVFAQTPEQLEYLSNRIRSGTLEVKRDALGELRRFGSESASRAAAHSLDDPEPIVRATAVGAVVYMPGNDAAALVEPLLRDRSDFVRREAVYALGAISFQDSVDPLIRVLTRDDDSEVRAAAAVALGRIGDISALEPLARILESKPKSSRSFLRRSAARSIGQIAQKERSGEVSIATPESFLPDKLKSGYGKPISNEALRIGFGRASAVLGKVLADKKESNDTRREASFALGAIGDESSVALLRRFANDPDYYLAEICREALIKLTDR